MRKFRFIFLLVAVLLATGACTRLDDPQVNLDIFIRFPDPSQTKADTDVAPDNAKETRIVDLRIWVFASSSSDEALKGRLLGYLAPTKLDYSGDAVNKFTIVLEKDIASKIKKADVYVLANAKSAGLDKDGLSPVLSGEGYKKWSDLSADELDGIVMSGNAFGIKLNSDATTWGPTNTGVIDTQGLPFSAVGKGLDIGGSGSHLSVETVELVRAVSKVQFVFSQIMDSQNNKPAEFTITGLKLNGNKLAEKELANGETIMVYSIRFSTDTTTYKYYIDANTGAILYKKTEFCAADFILKNNNSKADTEGNLHTDTQESEKHSRQYKQGD